MVSSVSMGRLLLTMKLCNERSTADLHENDRHTGRDHTVRVGRPDKAGARGVSAHSPRCIGARFYEARDQVRKDKQYAFMDYSPS